MSCVIKMISFQHHLDFILNDKAVDKWNRTYGSYQKA